MNWAGINWDAVLAIAQIVGDVFVFLSLIYVGLQIREDARARRAQTMHQQSAAYTDLLCELADNRELADIYSRGVCDVGALQDSEVTRFAVYVMALFRVYEDTYLQYELGHLAEQVWLGMQQPMRLSLSQPGVRALWRQTSSMFSADFRALVEAQLKKNPVVTPFGPSERLNRLKALQSELVVQGANAGSSVTAAVGAEP